MSTSARRATDIALALLLVVAFSLAGWKVAARSPSADFASPAAAEQQVPSIKSAPTIPMELSPDGQFGYQASFVSSVPGQAVHAASLVELRDGRLRAVWFSGSREGAGDVAIRTAVMDPQTLRWGVESTLIDRVQIQQGLFRYVKKLGNPVIARAPDGSLMLWMVTVSLGGWAGSSISWVRSVDDGATWSQPRRLVTSPFLNISTLVKGAPVALVNGELLLPVYHEFITKLGEVVRLDTSGGVIDKTRIPGSQTDLQPVILVSGRGNAQVYLRSGKAKSLMVSSSIDAGKTWSDAAPTAWPNPDSALAGVVTGSGQQWLALNPAPRDREILALLQSRAGGSFDGASTWRVEASPTPGTRLSSSEFEQLLGKELVARGANDQDAKAYVASAKRQLCNDHTCSQEFSYPYLLQSRDGYLHLVYTWHRSRIKHVRLDPLQPVAKLNHAPAQ